MPGEYPKKYWWLVLVAVPVIVAVVQLIPYVLDTKQSKVTEIGILPSHLALKVGESAILRAEARGSSGVIRDAIQFQWQCLNSSIASISPTGTVTGLREGATTIVAKGNGATGIAELIVKAKGKTVPPPKEPPGGSGTEDPLPVQPPEDHTAKNRQEIERLVSLGIDSISRGDVYIRTCESPHTVLYCRRAHSHT